MIKLSWNPDRIHPSRSIIYQSIPIINHDHKYSMFHHDYNHDSHIHSPWFTHTKYVSPWFITIIHPLFTTYHSKPISITCPIGFAAVASWPGPCLWRPRPRPSCPSGRRCICCWRSSPGAGLQLRCWCFYGFMHLKTLEEPIQPVILGTHSLEEPLVHQRRGTQPSNQKTAEKAAFHCAPS